MDKITHCKNHNRFIPIDSEELTALELIGKTVEKSNELVDKSNNHEERISENERKKVSFDDMKNKYKFNNETDIDYRGKWFGLDEPTLSDEGMRSQVQKNRDDILKHSEQLDNIIVRPEMFNGTNDSEKIQKAINYFVGNKRNGVVTLVGEFDLTDTINIDISYCSLQGNATLKCDKITNKEALNISGGDKLYNSMAYQNKSFIRGISLIGGRATGSVGVKYEGKNVSGLTIEKCDIQNFDTGILITSNTYLLSHIGTSIGRCNICVNMPAGYSNYGENISFVSCCFSNSQLILRNENANGNFHLYSCSLDYSSKYVDSIHGGVILTDCHFETNNGNQQLNKCMFETGNSPSSYIKIDGGLMLFWNTPSELDNLFYTNFPKFNQITIENCKFLKVNGFKGELCGGTGMITTRNIMQFTEGYQAFTGIVSKSKNLLYNPTTTLKNMSISADGVPITDRLNGGNIALGTSNNILTVNKKNGSTGAFDVYIPINNNCVPMYRFSYKNNASLNGNNCFVSEMYGVVEYKNGLYEVMSSVAKGTANRVITPQTALSDTVVTSQADGNIPPIWATHYIISFNCSGYSGTFDIKDLFVTQL